MKREKESDSGQSELPRPFTSALDRRLFLGKAAGLGAAGALFGAAGYAEQLPDLSAASSSAASSSAASCDDEALGPEKPGKRKNNAYKVRVEAAKQEKNTSSPCHDRNDDEEIYSDQRASYSKGLVHDSIGEVDLGSYQSMLDALESGDPEDFEQILIGNPGGAGTAPGNSPVHKQVNPQAGLAYDLEGADSHALVLPPAPDFAGPQQASEAIENLWMAHLRDVPFRLYDSDPGAAAAIADLNAASDFRGPKQAGLVGPQTLFRDPFPGCTLGPYLSQFWYRPLPFGTQSIDTRSNTYAAGIDYLTNAGDWLASQNGVNPGISNAPAGLVYMRSGRDIGAWVHVDVLFQGFFQAFLALSAAGVKPNPGNPYRTSATQVGFGTFGGPHFATVLCEVSTRALKAMWFQKWFVHRRLRPEVFLGRVHYQVTGVKDYGVHPDILDSAAVAESFSRHGSYFLPQAFPEGAPAHPSYGAGHAVVAGACSTILKAMFDTEHPVTNFFPVVEPSDDGLSLVPYLGSDVGQMTLAGELNKLASNVATGRNIAGVHWRTDGEESLLLGEAVAIRLLANQAATYTETFSGFTFTKFDGTAITV